MDAIGRAEIPFRIVFHKDSKERVKPSIIKWMAEGKRLRISMVFEAYIAKTAPGGVIELRADEYSASADVHMETWYKRRTIKQLATLKAIESLLYWSHNNMFPPRSTDLAGYHQSIMELAGIRELDPSCGKAVLLTTSNPRCTTEHMNRFIEIAVTLAIESDLPPNMIEPATEMDFITLYREWYKARTATADCDGLTKDEYKKRFPYDEFNCIAETEDLQIMHIVSKGAGADVIDESWNWIRGPSYLHIQIQHQHGWEPILQEFPHIIPKVERAREMAKKKGLI